MRSSQSKAIDEYLSTEAPSAEVFSLLKLSLGRVLAKIADRGEDWTSSFTADDLRHICDWLAAAILDKSPWLARLDDAGRPKKLMKFSTVASILVEADKAMLVFAQKHGKLSLAEGEETVWLDLENGFVLVRLLTTNALDRESAVMQHCIGGGFYDQYLQSGKRLLLSLRDAYGKAHATIEVDTADGRIIQLQGKQNKLPDRRYLAAMGPAFLRPDFNPSNIMNRLGFVLSPTGELFDKFALPTGAVVAGDLDYQSHPKGFSLPAGLTVHGSLTLSSYAHGQLPDGLTVHGALKLKQCDVRQLPSDMVVHGMIFVDRGLEGVPDGFHARSDLYITGAIFDRFPADLKVDGILSVGVSSFPHLPASLRVLKNIGFHACEIGDVEADFTATADLTFRDCRIGSLADGMVVGGNLSLVDSAVKTMPENASVSGSLTMVGTRVREIPSGWRIGGSIIAGGSTLVSLPARPVVSGDLNLESTNITELDDLRSVAGDLCLSNTRIKRLPRELNVTSDLDAGRCHLAELPDGVRVGGRLLLSESKVTSLPADFSVGGACDLSNTGFVVLPEGFSCGAYLDVTMTGIRRIPKGIRAKQLICDDNIEDIADYVVFTNGVILPAVPDLLTVEAMRRRIVAAAKAA